MFAPISVFLADPDATNRLAVTLAPLMRAGDCLLMSGHIGAGKSQVARALIRTRLGRMEEVPSPSFTLVQTYADDPDIWHADLYRLSHPDEVLELGLDDAFATAICLIEWPDRLGRFAPPGGWTLALAAEGDGRRALLGLPPAIAAAFLAAWARDD